jgi:NAD(P)-dependent dehydrogenase (short-subunit alcohol dehydrogenase family)
MVGLAVETYGRLDILFNNAGLTLPARVTETSEEVWNLSLDVNLKGVMLGCKYAIPEMQKVGGGSIINTASMLGLVASPRQAPYCAAKGGVVLLTKQIAIDYARDNIRVNCICPSEVDTPMHRKFIAESPDPEATKQRLLERIPLNRVARPEEIAAAALFLASDDSSYVTGVALPVDGGLTAL